MEVEGSFDNWTTRQTMQRSGKDFTIVKLLPPGVYQVTCCGTSCLWGVESVPPNSEHLKQRSHQTWCKVVGTPATMEHSCANQGICRRSVSWWLAHMRVCCCSTSSSWMGSGSMRRTCRPCTTSATSSTMLWRSRSMFLTTWTASWASSRRPRPQKGQSLTP